MFDVKTTQALKRAYELCQVGFKDCLQPGFLLSNDTSERGCQIRSMATWKCKNKLSAFHKISNLNVLHYWNSTVLIAAIIRSVLVSANLYSENNTYLSHMIYSTRCVIGDATNYHCWCLECHIALVLWVFQRGPLFFAPYSWCEIKCFPERLHVVFCSPMPEHFRLS